MDTEYSLMCKEATEIQELWKPRTGDMYQFKMFPESVHLMILGPDLEDHFMSYVFDHKLEGCFWLPRQEDIQQIFKEEKQVSEDITLLLFKRYIADLGSVCTQCEGMSITKAWLCCIMEKLYAKDWDSESKTWVSL